MQYAPDASTVDLTRTRLKVCDNVTFQPQIYGDETFYHIRQSATSLYYRVGFTEYVFISLLDGKTTFSEALAVTARTQGASALGQEQAMSLYTWLLEQKVARIADVGSQAPGSEQDKNRAANVLKKMNPFWIRIPFGRPEAFLKALQPFVGWMFSPPAAVIAVFFMIAAALRLAADWDQFSAAAEGVFAKDNWLWLLVAWILLKCTHEIAHGITCQRYGGDVKETGIILAFFAPLAFVDVTSCWSFSSRWKRIHVAAAGMYVELLLASAAVFLWTKVDSANASHLLYNIIVMASVSTLIFNANPLMRFDGYYILSDLLELPNLYTQSGEAIKQFAGRWVWGTHGAAPVVRGKNLWVLRAYGFAAIFWRLLICFSLLLAASVLFHGAGIALVVAGTIAWFGMPLFKFASMLVRFAQDSPARLLRGGLVTATILAVAGIVLFKLPVPFSTVAPGIVEIQEGRQIRSEVDGFIEKIYVSNGQHVGQGDLLMVLQNDEVTSQHQDINFQIQQETIRHQMAMKQHESGNAVVAMNNLNSLRDQLKETAQQIQALEVRAPTAGRVVAHQLHTRIRNYVSEGDELLLVDDGQPRHLRVSVAQEDFHLAEELLQQSVAIRIGTRDRQTGVMERVIPRASRRLFNEALAATEGGTLAVTSTQDEDTRSSKMELTSQRFEAIVSLTMETADQLPIGERGYVSLGSQEQSLAVHLYRSGKGWLEDQIETAQRAADSERM